MKLFLADLLLLVRNTNHGMMRFRKRTQKAKYVRFQIREKPTGLRSKQETLQFYRKRQ